MVLRVLAICFDSEEGYVECNVRRADEAIRRFAEGRDTDLVVLPELFTCGYCGSDFSSWAEDENSPTFGTFRRLCEEIDSVVGWGFVRKAEGRRPHNCYALLEPGKPPLFASKTHLNLSRPGSKGAETEFFSPGECLGVLDTRIGRLGVMICADGMYPEVPRCLALQGAECIIWASRSGGSQAEAGVPTLRATENIIPVVHPDGSQYGGWVPEHSAYRGQIVDHHGKVLADSAGTERMLYAELDLDAARDLREHGFDLWATRRMRRPELYTAITERQPKRT